MSEVIQITHMPCSAGKKLMFLVELTASYFAKNIPQYNI